MGSKTTPHVFLKLHEPSSYSPPSNAAIMERYSYTSTHPLGHNRACNGNTVLLPLTVIVLECSDGENPRNLCVMCLGIECNYWIIQTGYIILVLFPIKCGLFHDFIFILSNNIHVFVKHAQNLNTHFVVWRLIDNCDVINIF